MNILKDCAFAAFCLVAFLGASWLLTATARRIKKSHPQWQVKIDDREIKDEQKER